jgi:hypothetical protein
MSRTLAIVLSLIIALAVLFLVFTVKAQAQQRLHCAARDSLAATLTEKHGEVPVLRGVAGSRVLIEVWLSDSGSFSIIITQPTPRGQLSCMLAAGTAMNYVKEPEPGEKL